MLLIIISLFSISASFAQDNVTCEDDIIECEDEVPLTDDVISSVDETPLTETPLNFSSLNKLIRESTDSNIYLQHDYKYDESADSAFSEGIVIDRQVNIFGNGKTIDGSGKARIFNIPAANVFLNGITFTNGNAQNGGAIIGNSYGVINCRFIANHANNYGGAIVNGYAENCLFESNVADYGGAMYNGSALKSNFTKNSAKSYGAAAKTILTSCQFTYNNASNVGGAVGDNGCSAYDCTFIGNYAINEGGAVYAAYVNSSRFMDNHANYGGAISGMSDSVSNSYFTDNYANEMGGALYNIYAVDCEFRRNHAREGGAMFGSSARRCNFISNYATDSSGGIKGYAEDCYFVDNSAYRAGAVEGDAKNSVFEENHAITGGALYISSAENCEFIKNYAEEGGAIYGGSAAHCTFTENTADTGAGMYGGSATFSNFTGNVAEITGGAYYRTAVSDCYVQGNIPKYILEVSDFQPTFGFSGEVQVKLSDSRYGEINNVKLLLKAYDKNNREAFVSNCYSGGTCYVNLDLGEFTIVVSVADRNYDIEPVSKHVVIKKFTSFYVVSVTATYGINNPLIVNLHDIDGGVLRNVPITVSIDGSSKTYTTNNNGQVLVSTVGLTPKTHNVVVNYGGSANYHPSSATAKITVNKAKPYIIVSNMKYYKSEKTKKFYMILKDNCYRVMKNTKVTLKVNGKKYTAKTNAKGRATFKITKLKKKGKFKATASYSGNSYYTSVSASAKITVKKG